MPGEPTRRRYLAGLVTVATAGFAGCPRSSGGSDTDESNLGPLERRWEVSIPDPAEPTFDDAGIYLGARYGLVGVDSSVGVYALARDGNRRWRARTGDGTSGVGLDADTAYVGSSDGGVYAFDTASGSRRWRYRYGSGEGVTYGSWLRPTVVDDVVVTTVEYPGSDGEGAHAVIGLDTESGERLWRTPIADNAFTDPVVVDGVVVFGADDGRIYAVEAASGDIRWRVETGYGVRGSPVRRGDTLFVGSRDDRLYALGTDGSERWTVKFGNDVDAGPAVDSGRVYAGSADYTVAARAAATGDAVWRHEGRAPVTAMAVDGDIVYAGTDDGRVRAHAADTGEVRWSATLSDLDRRIKWLAARDGRLYLGDHFGVHAYDRRDGDEP